MGRKILRGCQGLGILFALLAAGCAQNKAKTDSHQAQFAGGGYSEPSCLKRQGGGAGSNEPQIDCYCLEPHGEPVFDGGPPDLSDVARKLPPGTVRADSHGSGACTSDEYWRCYDCCNPTLVSEYCFDGIDNDCDQLVDADDSDC
jgi:hypothetical protein